MTLTQNVTIRDLSKNHPAGHKNAIFISAIHPEIHGKEQN